MSGRILVINPNSTQAVTDGIDRAMEPLRLEGGPRIDCATLAEGPPGVQSQRDVDGVVAPLLGLIQREDNATDAFVIACFSDPGLHAAREATARPVIGIMEAGLTTALNLGGMIGIIAIQPPSVRRHIRTIRAMGLSDRIAGERAIGLDVVELADEALTYDRMAGVARALKDEDGAEAIVMGCAGMARYRPRLEDALGIAVIDPSQAAAGMAITAVRLGYRTGMRAAA